MLTILQGDALSELRKLPDESVQCCVTSPPYWGLRDYSCEGQLGLEKTPEEYVAKMVGIFREVRRVLRKDGTLWLNLGDSYAQARGGRSEGSHDNGVGRGDAPNNGSVSPPAGFKAKDLIGIPWRVAFALQADGWWLRSDIIWSKPNPMPESVMDRPTKAHEYLFLLTKSASYFYDAESIKERADPPGPTNPRAKYNGLMPSERRGPLQPKSAQSFGRGDPKTCDDPTRRNKRSVWTVATAPYPEAHFATYPPDLIKPCIMAGSSVGDTVLDPFAGSGTTGMVALELGRKAILIELNPKYVSLIEQRCDVTPGLNLA